MFHYFHCRDLSFKCIPQCLILLNPLWMEFLFWFLFQWDHYWCIKMLVFLDVDFAAKTTELVISSNSFPAACSGLSMCDITSSDNMDIWTSSFPILMPSLCFCSFIALAIISNLVRAVKVDLLTLFQIWKQMLSAFPIQYHSGCQAVIYCLYNFEVWFCAPTILNFVEFFFNHKECWSDQMLSLHLLRWSYTFCSSFCWCDLWHLLICKSWVTLASLG